MDTKYGIRHRFATLVLLGIVTSALSLVALVRILSITTAQRVEHAHVAVREELARLGSTSESAQAALSAQPAMAMIGMRGGYLTEGDRLAALPNSVRAALSDARIHAGPGRTVIREHSEGSTTLVLGLRSLGSGRSAWAGFWVQPPTYLRTWQIIVALLTIATAAFVATTIYGVLTFKSSTAAIHASLLALATDLRAPIPRPRIREIGEIADGIRRLAEDLARSREVEGRLGHELAQKERLAALGRVVAGVAHEVRNPLASIKLQLDLTAVNMRLPAAAQRAISSASAEISRLDRLVADLLVVAGRQPGTFRTVPLGELVRARVEALAPWSSAREVQICVRGDATAMLDPESMARALDNLLRNSVEASPPGKNVEVRVLERSEQVRVYVEDHGVGVSAERAHELFEPFFTTKPDGTGLGLAISRAIARAHGGEVTYSRHDEITRFELCLARRAVHPLQERSS